MDVRYPRTLPGLFDRAFRKYADRTAIVDGQRSLTVSELDERSMALAAGLAARGVDLGDRVGILLANGAAYPVVDAGVTRAGATRVPLNPQFTATELTFLLDDAGAGTVICDAPRVDELATAAADGAPLERVIVVGTGANADAALPDGDVEWLRYGDVIDGHADATTLPTPAPDDDAAQFYTGGTTGDPKGVYYSHRCLVANLTAVIAEFGFGGRDAGILVPPLSHSAGTFCHAAILAGGTVHLRDGFDPDAVLSTVADEDVTWTFLVPTMLYRLLDGDRDLAPLSSLDRILYGAAPIRTDRLREAIDRIGPIFHQFYGQTEVPNLITSLPPQEHARAHEAGDVDRLASAGTACLRATVTVRDRETGERLPPGEAGEVVVAAPYAFDGYHERPEETAAVCRDGWVHTGDVGVLDGDGYLTLLDRESGVIVTGGMNVYGQTVERAVRAHPAIDDVVIVGVPHDEWGEAVHAVVVPSDAADREPTIEDLDAFLEGRLAGYKQPKSLTVVDSLPMTALGKRDRASVRERFWDDADRSVQ